METLINTPFFCILSQQNNTLTIDVLSTAYKDFLCQLVQTCITETNGIPVFFTLHFTHVELVVLHMKYKEYGAINDGLIEQYTFKAALAVESALEWVRFHAAEYRSGALKKEKMETGFVPQWTADIIDLVEISMSLHERRAINSGEISITAVVNLFFKLFDLKPGNFFSSYGVMRTRAGSRTRFLDELKRSLENKMDKDDEKEIRR